MSDIVEYGKYKDLFVKKEITTNTALIRQDQKNTLALAYNQYWASPKYKLKWFVGQAEFTPFHKIRQYLLELRTREDSIENQEYELAKVEADLAIQQREYDNETDELKKNRMMVEIKRMKNGVQSTAARVRDLYIEREYFLELIDEFNNSPEGKLEDGRRLIDLVGTPIEEKMEHDYWTVRLARQAAMDLCSYGRIGAGNLDAIMNMGTVQQEETLKLAHTIHLALEQKQNIIREQVAQNLQITDTGKLLYIGELDPDLINNAIQADRELMNLEVKSLNKVVDENVSSDSN